jgi:uncharacterized protein YjaZ
MTTENTESAMVGKMTKAYIRIRDAKAKLKLEYDTEDKKFTEQMDTIKRALLDHCKEHGVDSVRTASGLFYRSTKTRYWTGDWQAMHAFIMEHSLPEFLEKRLNQTAVKAYIEENPEITLPALNVDSEYSISVRKA